MAETDPALEPAEPLDDEPEDSFRLGERPADMASARHAHRVERVIEELGLAEAESAHQHLAEAAVWLALMNLELELEEPLEDWLLGLSWEAIAPGRASRDPFLQRLALGLVLQEGARQPGAPAAARALAALATLALGCADPAAGARLQRGCASLGLLPLVDQVPVALPIRALALEFRHLPLGEGPPPAFVARIEDLLDRLDATGLLGVRLSDHPAVRDDPALPRWEALLHTRAPSLLGLARVLLAQPTPWSGLAELQAALEAEGYPVPEDPSRAEALLTRRYASLRRRLGDTPFALLDPSLGYGLAEAQEARPG